MICSNEKTIHLKRSDNIKTIRTLLILFAITSLSSCADVFAYNVKEIRNVVVPGFNGKVDTGHVYIDTVYMGQHHKIRDIDIERSLDVRLRKYNTYELDNYTDTQWYPIYSDTSLALTNSLSPVNLFMQGGEFVLQFDSRIHYVTSTDINYILWYLEV